MASIPSARFPPPSSAAYIDHESSKFLRKVPVYLPQPQLLLLPRLKHVGPSRSPPSPFLCFCHNSPSSGENEEGSSSKDGSSFVRWDSLIEGVVRGAAKRWDELVAAYRNSSSKNGLRVVASEAGKEDIVVEEKKVTVVEENGEDWDWERWKQHFMEIEEHEKLVSVLKSQLNEAILREDYGEAAKLKLAITGATRKDIVGAALTSMNRAIEEERYSDAAFIRDHVGAGLVGWWAGISEDGADPYGRIICITPEYGRYVARSYSPRQLASGKAGFPLFEIFFIDTDGDYRQQVVYFQKAVGSEDLTSNCEEKPGFNSLNSYEGLKGENNIQAQDIKTVEGRDDDLNMMDGISIIQNVIRDLIPGSKVRVLKLVSPGKVNRDIIAKVVEQIMEEEDDGEEDSSDEELESVESDDLNAENDIEEIEMGAGDSTSTQEEKSELSFKVIIGDVTPKSFADVLPTNLVRVPAKLEKRDNSSFSITLGQDAIQNKTERKKQASKRKALATKNADLLSSDLAKIIPDKDGMRLRVLKDLQELINYSINNRQNYHSLFETTLFSQIEIPTTSDTLSGLYIGSHGMYSSNVLHLKRKFGQWQEDGTSDKYVDLEFYEYVEAFKLTGDPSVPAGQVAFRAKLGKQNQLPHKGIIPEEFGVIARYKGQGRLANPGFQNPRWVDGELVIFDGKYIRGGPVIGFVYLAPQSHFLFFNRLSLPA
ncbi:protein EXECUTER 1, chloroplastic-like [Curcuma longa]|uniref:protein EXECUTER 1, chloroplastic-like n=1 Tax=Curcuma longa TaxID=136217 RepID=UPI003D9F7D5D